MLIQQGRVFAANPDAAAIKIRSMWGNGRLVIKYAERLLGWYEYQIIVGEERSNEMADKQMSWRKCKGCEFLMETSTHSGVEYTCKITGEILVLKKCVKGEWPPPFPSEAERT